MSSKLIKGISVISLGMIIGWNANSQEIKALKVDKAPIMDGKLDDPCWNSTPEINNFTVCNSDKAAERKTFAKIVYTDTAIFFGIKAMVPSDKLIANETPRDKGTCTSDCVEVMLDPSGTGDSYYHFVVNAANSILDRSCEQGGFIGNTEWDSDMKSAVHLDKDFWSCEIMIPYYSLGFLSPPKGNWGINICRESYNPGQELSSIAEKGLFNVGSSFRRLCKLDVDFSLYCWNIEIPKSQSTIKDGKLSLTLKGIISNLTEAERKIKVDCALFDPDGKMYNKDNSEKFATSEKRNFDYGPFMLGAQGSYQCQIELASTNNGRTLSKRKFTIPVHYVPMRIDLQKPWYRDAIFATQKLEKVKFTVGINLPADKISNTMLEAGIRASGKVLQSAKTEAPKADNPFSFDVAGLPDGKLEIFAELKNKDGKVEAVTIHPLLKLPYKKGEVWRGKDLNWYVDGKKIFILAAWCGEAASNYQGFNMFVGWKRPGAMFISSATGFGYPPNMRKAIKENNMSEKIFAFYKERVRKDKDNPELFGYYLWDEPDCQGINSNTLNAIYQVIRDEDPYHPVIISSGTNGATKYPDCAEINGFHCYPKVSINKTMNNFRKIVVCMDKIDEFFKNRNGQQTIAYLHQGFNYGDYDDSSTRVPNYEEFRNQNLMSLILGSKGLLQYNTAAFPLYPELYIGLPYLVKEQAIVGNEAIIATNAVNPAKCDKAEMRLLTKDNNGDIWILACNASDNPGKFTINIPGLDGKTLQVLSEARNVKVSNGNFTDDFSHYEVHVYTSSSKNFGLTTVSKIITEIAAANKARHKPGNIAFQNYENEHIIMSCSSSKGAGRRADNGLWHLTDGIFSQGDPAKNSPPYVAIWEDKTDKQSPDWIEMKLSKPAEIGRVVIYSLDKSLKNYKVEAWINDKWAVLDEVKDKKEDAIEHKFRPVKIDRIRIFVTATNGPNAKIMEVELYEK
ncbi:MAG: hypothetical protein A2017_10525 [Lentisphaerae bacterium GWF2_44_16]|nr:MAG: hypothetical protein A2017_10525 [Lentisphaerae bacterium GWF2_44_16]